MRIWTLAAIIVCTSLLFVMNKDQIQDQYVYMHSILLFDSCPGFYHSDSIYSKWDIKKPGDLYHCVLHMIHLIQILIICHALLFLYWLSFLNSWRWTYFGFWLSELVCCISYSVGFGFSICPVHNGVFKCHSIQSTPACIFRFSENLDKSSRFQKQAYDVNTITVIL